MATEIFEYKQPFTLENGTVLPGYHLAYTTLGKLNARKDNVVWVFHALTANSNPADWWPGLVGEGRFFDPAKYFIICVNMPGSCYGSIGPLEINPQTGERWYHSFPLFTTRDMVRAYKPLKDFLGIEKIDIGIGGSMGGQQLLEWAVEEPQLFDHIVALATNAQHSPWGIALNASQRMCIETDATWQTNTQEAGINGMKAARSVALLSYRNYNTYNLTQPRDKKTAWPVSHNFGGEAAESYQRYQGEKLANRFNAFSYYRLGQGMDAHDLGRGRGSVEEALRRITAKTLVIGITSDLLFPPEEQVRIADGIPGAIYQLIESLYGHDGFLLEYEKIEQALRHFIREDVLSYLKIINR
ncbi:homoserine O-acetyltransferase [Terrimonas sp.]|uniref:homoserine O-acetyltransferase family protein n=1 Tax=Terrimonas sp. TaxID=1914338 RepID=UPI000D523D2D|nr:homoserine O-acetyltransferase [Terrimonas sp.]PVD53880.1 homoserine O-acetyltransferase [Terrimonas sp.]